VYTLFWDILYMQLIPYKLTCRMHFVLTPYFSLSQNITTTADTDSKNYASITKQLLGGHLSLVSSLQ